MQAHLHSLYLLHDIPVNIHSVAAGTRLRSSTFTALMAEM